MNPCELFNVKFYLYIYIKYIEDKVWFGFMAYQPM